LCEIADVVDGAVGDDLQKIFLKREIYGISSKLKEIWMPYKRHNILYRSSRKIRQEIAY